jgi:hypothetical protein
MYRYLIARRMSEAAFLLETTDEGLHGLRPVSATRPWPHFRRCSFGITACRLAVTGQFTALAATASMRTFLEAEVAD